MVFETNLLLSILLGLLEGSFVIAIPVFFILLFAGFLRKKLAKKYSLNWIVSVFIISIILLLPCIIFLYFYPIIISIPEQTIGVIPSVLQPTTEQWFLFWFYISAKLLAVTVIISIILMPFILLGSFLQQYLDSSKQLKGIPSFAKSFIALYITLMIFFGLLFYLFYWIVIGLMEILFFG